MKILILGSQGFIGNHLANYFLMKGFAVSGCDLFEAPSQSNYQYYKVSRLSPEWEDVFSTSIFDYCVNAAGSGNVMYSMTHPLSDFEANTLDTIRILDAIRRLNTNCRYLHISSAAVYGNPEKLPVQENARKNPVSPYGWNKLMAEQICTEYNSVYGISTAIVRPFSVYGNGLRKQLLWDICTKLHKTDMISLFGSGKESRDFIHIHEMCEAIMKIVEASPFACNIYNAATGTETTVQQIAEIFEKYFPGQKKISFSGEEKKGDPINWKADISSITQLGFKPSISIEKAIKEYINWYTNLVNE